MFMMSFLKYKRKCFAQFFHHLCLNKVKIINPRKQLICKYNEKELKF